MTTKSAQIYINQYLENNSGVSASQLCQQLIEQHGLSRDTYSTGRPKLYVDVVKYLERLQKNGQLEAVERSQVDCQYKVISTIIPEDLNNDKVESVVENNKNDDLQMSLF